MSAVANSEDQEICFACEEPLLPGQLVLQDAEEGLMHRACCGPERDAFCNLETGEPLGPDEPLPEGFPYAPATRKAPDAETRLRELALAAAHQATEAATELLRFAREGSALHGAFSQDVDVFEKLCDAVKMTAKIEGPQTDRDYAELRERTVHAIGDLLEGWV